MKRTVRRALLAALLPTLLPALVLVPALLPLAGCTTLYRYQVSLVALEDCIIRPNGEFCDEEEQLPPPAVEVWALEIEGEHTVLYIDGETWIAEGVQDQRVAVKERSTSRNGCTTTVTRTLMFNEDGQSLSGTFETKTRVTGPETCGDAPFGDRQLFDVVGEAGAFL